MCVVSRLGGKQAHLPEEQRQDPPVETFRASALLGVNAGAGGGGVWTSEGMSAVTLCRDWPSRGDQ